MNFCFRSLLLLTIAALIVSSCNKVDTVAPEETSLDSMLVPPISIVDVPVSFSISGIRDLINKKIGKQIFKKMVAVNSKGDSVLLDITKTGPIQISREKKTLYYEIPAHIAFNYYTHVAGVKIGNNKPVETDVIVRLSTTLAIDQKWNIVPNTRLDKINWVKEPIVNLPVIKINLRPIFEKVIDEKKDLLSARVDSLFREKVNTRKIVQKLWVDIQKPLLINRKLSRVWLSVNCTDITGKFIDEDPDRISFKFELKTRVHAIFQGDSLPKPNNKLPDFRVTKNDCDSLDIYVHTGLSFERLNEKLNEELHNYTVKEKGVFISIKNIAVYGTKKGIAVAISVKGDVKGILYAEGVPVFDTIKHELAIKDFAFDIETENVLAHSANWLLHSDVLEEISHKLVYNFEDITQQLPALIMNGIEKGKSGDMIDVEIGRLNVLPQNLLVTKRDIQLIVRGTGKASIALEKKVFQKKR
jgi:hypothetical protein